MPTRTGLCGSGRSISRRPVGPIDWLTKLAQTGKWGGFGGLAPLWSTHASHPSALHLSLALRVAGDMAGLAEVRRWGGMLNGATVALFVATTLLGVWRARGGLARPAEALRAP